MLNDLFVAIIDGIELAIVKLDPTVGIMVMVGTGGFLLGSRALWHGAKRLSLGAMHMLLTVFDDWRGRPPIDKRTLAAVLSRCRRVSLLSEILI